MPKTLKKRQNEPELHFQPDQNYISKIEIANPFNFSANLTPQNPFPAEANRNFPHPKNRAK